MPPSYFDLVIAYPNVHFLVAYTNPINLPALCIFLLQSLVACMKLGLRHGFQIRNGKLRSAWVPQQKST